MFKLESYITPLLLSYVDKYVKNIKPEDSQVSLWGGEAVFNNLDLKLEVLEQELNLPFTFVNGHVHELRIHVPWTKLGSEPVVVTINTIECIFRLRSTPMPPQRRHPPVSYASLDAATPSSYVQNLINRILNNICIICNNIILKYVEEDIVLSVNVKSAEVYPANPSWDRAFVEGPTLPDMVLRKVIQVQDLTICLDKRDASGKIETYQDPLLYRCSLLGRVYSQYSSQFSMSTKPIITRVHVFCNKLEFSITDQQLPMFLRLLELGLALYFGDLVAPSSTSADKAAIAPSATSSLTEGTDQVASMPNEENGEAESGQSWGSWAWSLVPQILPTWESEESEEQHRELAARRILQAGVFVDFTSCVFKIAGAETNYLGTRVSFKPLAYLHQYGSAIEFTRQGDSFINVSVGISGLAVAGLHSCPCGVGADFPNTFSMDHAFFKSGVIPSLGGSHNKYFQGSLFDPLAPENLSGENPSPPQECILDAEAHLEAMTEAVLLERFPAFVLDYLYSLELPLDWKDQTSEINSVFLEGSNWREQAICRAVLGSAHLDVTSGMVHRLTTFLHFATYDYPAYSSTFGKKEESASKGRIPSEDDVAALSEFIPTRSYHLTLYKPKICLHPANHPNWDPSKFPLKHHRRKHNPKSKGENEAEHHPADSLILLEWMADCVEGHITKPMYPLRLAYITSSLQPLPPPSFVAACHVYSTLKIFSMEISLFQLNQNQRPGVGLLLPCSTAFHRKSLICPEIWSLEKGNQNQIEHRLEVGLLNIHLSKPQLLALYFLALSWQHPNQVPLQVLPPEHVLNTAKPKLQIELVDFTACHFQELTPKHSLQVSLTSFILFLHHGTQRSILLHTPEDTHLVHRADFFSLSSNPPSNSGSASCCLNLNLTMENGVPRHLELALLGTAINLDPAFHVWLSYQPPLNFETSSPIPSLLLSSPQEAQSSVEEDAASTTTTQTSTTITAASSWGRFSSSLKNWTGFDLYNYLKFLSLQVTIKNICLLCPSRFWPVMGDPHILKTWQSARDKLPPTCVICFPQLELHNGSSRSQSHENFPWTLQALKMSFYTLLSRDLSYYIVKPLDATLTLAITGKKDSSQIGFCTHIHMEPLHVCCSSQQVSLCLEVINQAILAFQKLSIPVGCYPMPLILPSSTKIQKNVVQGTTESKEASTQSLTLETSFDPKPSLWLQLTLPKLTLQFFGRVPSSTNEFCLNLETEEITNSLDIQDVYTKMKIKIAMLNITSLQRRQGEHLWVCGPFEGIILSGSEKITRFITIFTRDRHQDKGPIHPPPSRKVDSRAFLNLTYTKALCSHVKQKLIKSGNSPESPSDLIRSRAHYLSEIDLDVRPFDIILWLPIFNILYDLWKPVLKTYSSKTALCPSSIPGSSQPFGWNLNTANLPLVYTKTSTIRVFLPLAKEQSPHSPDMCLFQIDTLCVQPQVENPISRIIMCKDLYHSALNANILGIPGSEIEDRQYQLEVEGVSLSSGKFQEIIQCSQDHPFVNVPPTLSENPALAWNTLQIQPETKGEVVLVPILEKSNFKIIFAPPVIFTNSKPHDALEEILVCGLTLEINVVLDIDISLSLEQVLLLHRLSIENLSAFGGSLSNSSTGMDQNPPDPPRDSGIESESSTLHRWIPVSSPMLVTSGPESKTETISFVPFEVLITAKSVTLLFYARSSNLIKEKRVTKLQRRVHHKPHHTPQECSKEDLVKVMPKSKAPTRVSVDSNTESSPMHFITPPLNRTPHSPKTFHKEEEEGYEGSHDSSSDGETSIPNSVPQPDPSSRLIPFLYVLFSQPHALLSCLSSNQKLEMSCFDVLVKGSASGYFVIEREDNLIPTSADFTIIWLETRPGEIPPKTGIPPALFTLLCTDFCHHPSNIQIKMERPLKLTWSFSKLEQLQRMYLSAKEFFSHHSPSTAAQTPLSTETSNCTRSEDSLQLIKSLLLSRVKSLQISVVQTMLLLDLVPDMKHVLSLDSVGLEFSLLPTSSSSSNKISTHTISSDKSPFSLEKIDFKLNLTGLLFKATFLNHSYHMFGPLSLSLFMTLASLNGPGPQTCWVSLFTDTVLVSVGPRQLYCIQALLDNLPSFKVIQTSQSGEQPKLNTRPQISKDDLRTGQFQYIQDTDNAGIQPKPHQIVFHKEESPSGEEVSQSTMTWCYPQPRFISKVEVYPVPFPSPDLCVDCQLQYWDSVEKSFKVYLKFPLSETDQQTLTLDHVDPFSPIPACNLWRVVLSSSEQRGISSISLAACLCIDSIYDSTQVPRVEAALSFSMIQVTLYNHFKLGVPPASLLPFQFDGTSPQEQEFAMISLNDITLRYTKKPNQQHLEACCNLDCLLLEYRGLTFVPLLDTLDLHLKGLYRQQDGRPILDTQLVLHPCTITLGQSALFTLSLAVEVWKQYLHPPSKENLSQQQFVEQLVPNHYIVCNNTQQTLRFGQDQTDESIFLASRTMHAYSWRSVTLPQVLHVCFEENKWSTAFDPDTISDPLVLKIEESKVIIVVYIKPLNTLQKQVIIEGLVTLTSTLEWPLEVKVFSEGEVAPQILTLSPSGVPLASFVRPPSRLCIRIAQRLSAPWSEDIPLLSHHRPNTHFLTKIPLEAGKMASLWCNIVEKKLDSLTTQMVVVLSPLFMITNHLPQPLMAYLDQIEHTQIPGQGLQQQLDIPDPTKNCHLSFQLCPSEAGRLSEPQVALSTSLKEKVCLDLNSLPPSWASEKQFTWPYDLSSHNREYQNLWAEGVLLPQCDVPTSPFATLAPEQPDTALKVGMRQCWPGCCTVVLDIWPWALVVNRTQSSVILALSHDDQEWRIPPSTALAPPLSIQEEGFVLGIVLGEETLWVEGRLSLADQDLSQSPYYQPKPGVIPSIGTAHIPLYLHREDQPDKIALVTICSSIHGEMRVLSIWPTFCITNLTSFNLFTACYFAPSSDFPTKNAAKIKIPEKRIKAYKIRPHRGNSQCQPLLLWEKLGEGDSSEPSRVFYLTFSSSPSHGWTLAVRLASDGRAVLSLPHHEDCLPLVLSSKTDSGITFLHVDINALPLVKIFNHTSAILYYGTALEIQHKDVKVEEELELHNAIPMMVPGSTQFYSQVAQTELSKQHIPTILLSAEPSANMWSSAIDTSSESDQFTHIPKFGHVRVYKEKVGHTLNLYIEAVSKVEVSAKEIRSRIGSLPREHLMDDQECTNVKSYLKKDAPLAKLLVYCCMAATQISLLIFDDTVKGQGSGPMLSLTLDNSMLSLRPVSTSLSSAQHQELAICIGHLQLDNLMKDGYDFPVVLLPLSFNSSHKSVSIPLEIREDETLLPQLNHAKNNSFLVTEIVFEHLNGIFFHKVNLKIKPLSLYLEDQLYHRLSKLHKSFSLTSLSKRFPLQLTDLIVPPQVCAAINTFLHPLYINSLDIEELHIDLSVHARLKLYLSVDHSPLSFKPFKKRCFLTTYYDLGQQLTYHYITGAILKAGWVVGSLDLLGNPAGLALALGTGISDLVVLPYQGLFKGPQAFFSGISSGTLSLLRNLTSSSLVSISNLADSISRNMDYISMDEAHLVRQDESRRMRPHGFSSTLIHGLSNFGISLLGAIGGIADHPMQGVAKGSSDGGVRGAAGGLVAGVGRGLVGAVAKPLGGMAELVASTGQELLIGAGWRERPTPRHLEAPYPGAQNRNITSSLKLSHKIIGCMVLLSVDASLLLSDTAEYQAVILALTPQALSILDKDEENQLYTFLLTELECTLDSSSMVHLTQIKPKPPSSEVEGIKMDDRVAEYIYTQLKTKHSVTFQYPERSNPPSLQEEVGQVFKIFIHPKLRLLFTSHFQTLQRRAQGKDFPI